VARPPDPNPPPLPRGTPPAPGSPFPPTPAPKPSPPVATDMSPSPSPPVVSVVQPEPATAATRINGMANESERCFMGRTFTALAPPTEGEVLLPRAVNDCTPGRTTPTRRVEPR